MREAEVDEPGDSGPCSDGQGGDAMGFISSSTSNDSGEE